jgi:HEXXH motif-containing protein
VRAGLPAEIQVPAAHGIALLPTFGTVKAGDTGDVAVRATSDGLDPAAAPTPAVKHQVTVHGIPLNVHIEDCDPYREFGEPVPPRLLGDAEVSHWRGLIDSTWDILTERHEGYAQELSAGLRTLIPLSFKQNVNGSSSRAAFGGIALSEKDSAVRLAEVLVHEMQHSKINALLDLHPLVHNDDRLWRAPWRTDPRPLIGVLHGIYAFTSVVEFWRIEREYLTGESQRRAAQRIFADRRHQVREAIDTVRSAPALTELGRRLVDAADERIARCEQSPVPDDILTAVKREADENRTAWHRKHGS